MTTHALLPPVLALALTACLCPPPYVAPDACEDDGSLEVTVTPAGPAPWDGFRWRVEESVCIARETAFEDTEPTILDALGDEVPIAPYGLCERWGDPLGLEPGTYTFAGWEDVPTIGHPGSLDFFLDDPPTFEVEPWGRDYDFEPDSVAGGTYVLPIAALDGCGLMAYLAPFLDGYGDMYLRLGQPLDGEVDFDLLWGTTDKAEDAQDCRFLSGSAALSETGELTWEAEHQALDDDPLIEGWGMALRLGFDGGGAALAGAESQALMQTAALSSLFLDDPQDLCTALGECGPCPDGSGDTCMATETFGMTGSRTERAFAEDLPSCWDLLDSEDVAMGCASAGSNGRGWAVLLGALPLVVGRRRGR